MLLDRIAGIFAHWANWTGCLWTDRGLCLRGRPNGEPELVRRGYAQVMTVPPNVRHQELFVKLQREAREQKRALWADPSEATTPSPVAQSGRQSAGAQPGVPPESAWTCPAFPPHQRQLHHLLR
jgi:Staphylococcal nuclease homologue